jgi:hypothetical protein
LVELISQFYCISYFHHGSRVANQLDCLTIQLMEIARVSRLNLLS